MSRKSKLRISTIYMVLILFPAAAWTLPLTRTLYIAPSDIIDFTVSADSIHTSRQIARERFSAGTGLWSGTSVNMQFDLLGNGVFGMDLPGDSSIEFISFIDSLSPGDLRTAFYCSILIPTGPDAYSSAEYRGVALGNNELCTGTVLAYEFSGIFNGFFNLFYTFRQGDSEDFYGGFSLDPSEGDTYKSALGLNPLHRDSFLYYKRLSDDYVSSGCAAVYSGLFPFVIFSELRSSLTFSRNVSEAERSGVNPLTAGLGAKYFIMDGFFLQGHWAISPAGRDNCIKWQCGFLFSLIF